MVTCDAPVRYLPMVARPVFSFAPSQLTSMQLLILGPFLPLGVVYAVLAGASAWYKEDIFWGMSIFAFLISIWCIFALRHMRRIELPGLSHDARLLFEKYNSAWAAPALTKISRVYFSLGQLVCVSASIHFLIELNWLATIFTVLLFFYNGHCAVSLDPTVYIKLHQLDDEAHEIATVYAKTRNNIA